MAQTMIGDLVARALAEDVGDGDVTTAATVPVDARARATDHPEGPGGGVRARSRPKAVPALDLRGARERLTDEVSGAMGPRPRLEVLEARPALLTGERTALKFPGRTCRVWLMLRRGATGAVEGTDAPEPRHPEDDARPTNRSERRRRPPAAGSITGSGCSTKTASGEPFGAGRGEWGKRSEGGSALRRGARSRSSAATLHRPGRDQARRPGATLILLDNTGSCLRASASPRGTCRQPRKLEARRCHARTRIRVDRLYGGNPRPVGALTDSPPATSTSRFF